MCLRFVGLCFSVLSVAGLTNVQAVQQNTIDFSKAVPNAQGSYFFYKKISRGDFVKNIIQNTYIWSENELGDFLTF